ncbi:hypothetical protein F4Z99_17475 [Candidatus Poribacteria bacterium]|nr:hypothetical protein [Candidatus Poribacteria bacterium]
MSNYQRKIAPGIALLSEAISRINQSNSDIAHAWVDDLSVAQNVLENPFQTVPKEHGIHITTSFCDPEGNSDNADDDDISFEREISAALLHTLLSHHVKYYNPEYKLQVSLQSLENWLNTQKALLRTTSKDYEFIEDEGITVADYKTDDGSIDVFIEYYVNY